MPRPSTLPSAAEPRPSLYQEITDTIIAQLEQGCVPWVQPWESGVAPPLGLPQNAATGRCYSGINILILWGAATTRGFSGQSWLTFRQAVRRASRMKGVVYMT